MLDQSAYEIRCLEKILDAYVRYEELERRKADSRRKNREKVTT